MDLVFRVDCGDGVFAVLDRGQCGFEHEIGDARCVAAANGVGAVNADLDMQAVMLEEEGLWLLRRPPPAGEQRRVGKGSCSAILQRYSNCRTVNGVRSGGGVATLRERRHLIEQLSCIGHYLRSALGAVALCGRVDGREGVGAIECVVEAAPTSIGRIQCIAGIRDRHYELRSGNRSDLRIDVHCRDVEVAWLGSEVADLAQVRGGLVDVEWFATLCLPPRIDLRLEMVAPGQQRTVAGHEHRKRRCHALPECGRLDARTGKGFLPHELFKCGIHFQSTTVNGCIH
jgi:hypothetical protein